MKDKGNSPYIKKKHEQAPADKVAIAKKIVEDYIDDLDAILLDAGSTAEIVAKQLFLQKEYLTIMTNNMRVVVAYGASLNEDIPEKLATRSSGLNKNELQIPGGRYNPAYEALFGSSTIKAIEKFTPTVTIIGLSGLKFNSGVYCHGLEDSEVKELLWQKPTNKRIIAAHWEKIGKVDAHAFGTSVRELKTNAELAVVVTSKPSLPEYNDNATKEEKERFEEMKKQFDIQHRAFDKEVQLMRKEGIIVEIVAPLHE